MKTWPCLHEFFAIVTHPRIYKPPTPISQAIDQIEAWLGSPSLVLIGETENYWRSLRPLLEASRVEGPQVHDARIAAICLMHGVDELWTVDRDFSRFPASSRPQPARGLGASNRAPQRVVDMFPQQETLLTVRHLYHRWHPQVVHDVHQVGARGAGSTTAAGTRVPAVRLVEQHLEELLRHAG